MTASEILGLITARGGSQRIPHKNIQPVNGLPMITYPIRALLDTGICRHVMVSTDDNEIAKVAESAGAEVPFLRSSKNSDHQAIIADVILEVLTEYAKLGEEFEYLFCLFGTSIFTSAAKLSESLALLKNAQADVVVGVIPFEAPIQRALAISDDGRLVFAQSEYIKTRSQDLPPRYHEAGQLLCLNVKSFLRDPAIYNNDKRVMPLILSRKDAYDIDDPDDLAIATLMLQAKLNRKD